MRRFLSRVKRFLIANMEWLIVVVVALGCMGFMLLGSKAEDGSITLDGKNAKIEESTNTFIEDAKAALNRIMNQDRPTDDETVSANKEPEGQGFYTTIDDILGRRLEDGNNDGGKGWQCSRYTGWLATGKWSYSSSHPDYGPANGKDMAKYLVDNFGFKYIDHPVAGAIGSGGFNTLYGHTAMYLYPTGTNTAMVNDANYVPLTVGTHSMDITGWVWVVPGNYNPTPAPTPEPTPEPAPQPSPEPQIDPSTGEDGISYIVKRGDTLGAILLAYGYKGTQLFGDNGAAQKVATDNGLVSRGLIYPGQTIVIKQEYLK